MAVHRLDRDQARRIAVRAALLDVRRPADLLTMVHGLGMLRVELTGIVAPAADHIAWSRLGDTHRPGHTWTALADGRLFERGWMLRAMSDLGLFLAGMRSWTERAGGGAWLEANEPFRRGILDRIADEGPMTSREIPDEAIVPWESSGWTRDRNVTQMLEILHMRGELAVVAHEGRLRVWDLAEHVYPADTVEVPEAEARRIRGEHLLAALGVAREGASAQPFELHRTMADLGEPAEIDGVPGRWRIDPAAIGQPFEGRTAILSPFDRLVFDRERLSSLFDFDYTLEMYQPAATRRWGAFALPILHGERLIGKIDARSDRKAGTFTVNAVHEDEPFAPAVRDAVDEQLQGLADWLRLRLVE